jgi:FkbM family methyltransferase
MTLVHRARIWVQDHFGLDVLRYPESDPLHGLNRFLSHLAVDLVVDVGANDGGYAVALRRLGYHGHIVSFEPLSEPFARLTARAADDPEWTTVQCALGDREGEEVVHVAGNSEASSSVLPMLAVHVEAAPPSVYHRDETVQMRRLDTTLPGIFEMGGHRTFLKIDVQGYERAVIEGSDGLFRDGLLVGVQAEMSFVPLYEGQMLWRETVGVLESRGYELVSLLPGFTDPRSGRLLQADGVFARRGT